MTFLNGMTNIGVRRGCHEIHIYIYKLHHATYPWPAYNATLLEKLLQKRAFHAVEHHNARVGAQQKPQWKSKIARGSSLIREAYSPGGWPSPCKDLLDMVEQRESRIVRQGLCRTVFDVELLIENRSLCWCSVWP